MKLWQLVLRHSKVLLMPSVAEVIPRGRVKQNGTLALALFGIYFLIIRYNKNEQYESKYC